NRRRWTRQLTQRAGHAQATAGEGTHPRMPRMTSRDSPVARATRIAASDQARVLAELARARRTAGLSHLEVGRACGMSRSMVARIETGQRRATVVELAAIGAAVGRDVRLQVYPAGDPIRDAGQLRLLGRLRA